MPIEPGRHRVAVRAAAPTQLGDYSTRLSGDCGPDGFVEVTLGEPSVCTVTNTAKFLRPGCLARCSREERECLVRGDDDPRTDDEAICRRVRVTCESGCPPA